MHVRTRQMTSLSVGPQQGGTEQLCARAPDTQQTSAHVCARARHVTTTNVRRTSSTECEHKHGIAPLIVNKEKFGVLAVGRMVSYSRLWMSKEFRVIVIPTPANRTGRVQGSLSVDEIFVRMSLQDFRCTNTLGDRRTKFGCVRVHTCVTLGCVCVKVL